MATKHTPGKWLLDVSSVHAESGAVIAEAYSGIRHDAVDASAKDRVTARKANARLIAAAPELLELLVKLDTVLRGTGSFYRDGDLAAEVAAVIAKATGDARRDGIEVRDVKEDGDE